MTLRPTDTPGIYSTPLGNYRVVVRNVKRTAATYREACALHAEMHESDPPVVGIKYHPDGYRMILVGPGNTYALEHRLVMADHLGHPLPDEWVVHHKLPCEGGTGDTADNRIENLVCFASASLHSRWHALLRKEYNLPSGLRWARTA